MSSLVSCPSCLSVSLSPLSFLCLSDPPLSAPLSLCLSIPSLYLSLSLCPTPLPLCLSIPSLCLSCLSISLSLCPAGWQFVERVGRTEARGKKARNRLSTIGVTSFRYLTSERLPRLRDCDDERPEEHPLTLAFFILFFFVLLMILNQISSVFLAFNPFGVFPLPSVASNFAVCAFL